MVGPVGAEEQGSGRIAFQPALEGLRGFALIGMLCYHSEFTWAVGGFLPIPTFFTLSGFLITSLFLAERERTGRIALLPFWARRFRRLMPAALLTLAAMTLFGAFVAHADQLARLRSDVSWALLYVANWHFWLSDVAYTRLFEAPSPVQHFWSLAIEEQFYLVFPAVAALGLRAGSRRAFGALLAVLCAASVLASVFLTAAGASIDRVYYGSDTRAAEILLGGLLAVWMYGRAVPAGAARRLVDALGVAGLLGMVALWATVQLESGWLYRGGFALYSCLSLAVIASAVQPSGPVRAFLALPGIRFTGRVSYGAYLFHWPIFLWLDETRTGLDGPLLFALRFVVTFGLAWLSYEYFESPIRQRRVLTGWRTLVATPAAFALVWIGTFGVTADAVSSSEVERAANAWFVDAIARPDPDPPVDPPSPFRDKPRIAYFGDSTAIGVSIGLGYWLEENDLAEYRLGAAELGCGLVVGGFHRKTERARPNSPNCNPRREMWPRRIAAVQPDVAVVMLGPWEVLDIRLPGDDAWRHIGDPVLDAHLRREMLAGTDALAKDGTLVVWLTQPAVEVRVDGVAPETPLPGSDPARMARYNALVRELEMLRPGQVEVIDVAAWMRDQPGGELSPRFRPDGTHLSVGGSVALAREWLGEELLRVYRRHGAAQSASRDASER